MRQWLFLNCRPYAIMSSLRIMKKKMIKILIYNDRNNLKKIKPNEFAGIWLSIIFHSNFTPLFTIYGLLIICQFFIFDFLPIFQIRKVNNAFKRTIFSPQIAFLAISNSRRWLAIYWTVPSALKTKIIQKFWIRN